MPLSHSLLSEHLEKEKIAEKEKNIIEGESRGTKYSLHQFPQNSLNPMNKSSFPNGINLPQIPHKLATHSQESIMKAIKVYMPSLIMSE